jgi:hypothetical protein
MPHRSSYSVQAAITYGTRAHAIKGLVPRLCAEWIDAGPLCTRHGAFAGQASSRETG